MKKVIKMTKKQSSNLRMILANRSLIVNERFQVNKTYADCKCQRHHDMLLMLDDKLMVNIDATKMVLKGIGDKWGIDLSIINYRINHDTRTLTHPSVFLDNTFDCMDCDKNTKNNPIDYYMVTNELWKKIVGVKGMLCLDCFEGRIGRKLNGGDLTNCPVNKINPYTRDKLN